jgi:epothilone synthetase B
MQQLAEAGVTLSVDADDLVVQAPHALAPELIDAIRTYKAQLRDDLREMARFSPSASLIEPHPDARHEPFPLTDLQRAYLLGRDAAIPLGGVGCHAYFEFDCEGLEPARLEAAWNALIGRHDTLRLVVLDDARQAILPEVPHFEVEVIDLRQADAETSQARLDGLRSQMSHRVYEPTRWPLFDLRTVLLADGRARVLASFDLIGADAATLFRILDDLAMAYRGGELPPLPVLSFRDCRMAEAKRSGSESAQRARAYWRDRIVNLPRAPQLPLATPLEALTPPRFSRYATAIDPATARALERASGQRNLTLAAVLNAAFAEVLAAWSVERHLLINLPIFLPPDGAVNVAALTGNFTNNVLVAADLRGGTFASRARRLWEELASALRHRAWSGVQVIRELQAAGGEPLYPIAPFVLTNLLAHRQAAKSNGERLGDMVFGLSQTPQVLLDHQIVPTGGGVTFHWDSVVGAFPDGLIATLAAAHGALMGRLASDSQAWDAASLSLLPPSQAAVRAQVNATQLHRPSALLHEGLFRNAQTRPDAIALIDDERSVSYGALSRGALTAGRALRDAGIEAGDTVGILLPSGLGFAVAALGALVINAVYLPLDPAAPIGRREREFESIKPRIVVVDATTGPTLAAFGLPMLILPHVDGEPAHPGTAAAPELSGSPDDLAYLMFTSGTTGLPKAVAIQHRGAVNTCLDIAERFAIGPNDRVLALSATTFDLSVFDMFGLWSAGGAVVVPSACQRLHPAAWLETMKRTRISVWNSVPALMTMLALHVEGMDVVLSDLRLVLLSGDWVPPSLRRRILAFAPNADIIALGGATEASIWSIAHRLVASDDAGATIPYGKPLSNQTIHVLDDALSARPDCVEGDIYIGGIGLAADYFGDAQRTDEAFVLHPDSGERLYRTGDRGRYRADGEVEFLGRLDTQLKLHGFRIEAGDVEAVLCAHAQVADAIVEVTGERFGTRRLTAFVVPRSVAAPSVSAMSMCAPVSENSHADRRPERRGLRDVAPDARRVRYVRDSEAPTPPQGRARRSARRFAPSRLPLAALAEVLAPLHAVPAGTAARYAYPSAGGIYPVQFYLSVAPDRVDGLPSGLYYVHPDGDLILIDADPVAAPRHHAAHNQVLAEAAAFTLTMFAHLPAISPVYGELSRDFCLLEAGYASQALMEASVGTACSLCPIGGLAAGAIADRVGLAENDLFLHALLGGLRDESAQVDGTPAAVHPPPSLATQLQQMVAAKLPPHMRPQDIVLLEAFPLTRNGKVDRKQVAATHARSTANHRKVGTAPKNHIEQQLARIAQQVLQLDEVDIDLEFFALGADSVKLVELAAAIERAFSQRLDLSYAFRYPTIRQMAAQLARGAASTAGGLSDAEEVGGARDPLLDAARERSRRRRRSVGVGATQESGG